MPIDVTQMVQPVRQALGPVGASLSEAWSAVLGDRITAWRLKNAAVLQSAVNSEVAKLGLKLDRSKIPERYALAWFEEATKQDEPEIQQLFARLLARAAAGDEDAADRRHLEILTRLTPMDAKVMEWFFSVTDPPTGLRPSMDEDQAWKQIKKEIGEEAGQSIEHLVTVGVFERAYSIKQEPGPDGETLEPGTQLNTLIDTMEGRLSIANWIGATARGMSLYRACASVPPADAPSQGHRSRRRGNGS